MAKKVIISSPKIGMNTDSHPSQLTEQDYTFARNAVLENESGNAVNIKNDKSNLLSSKFKDGFKVINATNDIDTRDTYFFLVNPETGVGEFGVIRDNQSVPDLGDFELEDCSECNSKIKLNDPLEEQEQTESQQYITLISDECHVFGDQPEKGFNFNINNPIKKTFIKNEKCGKTIYFDHVGNPPRHINLDNLGEYFEKEIPCQDSEALTCPDFEKMRVFKLFDIPVLEPASIQLGGSLRMGVYEFMIAYSNSEDMEISEYYSITVPVKVFDYNNRIQTQPDISDRTSYSLKLDVKGLDSKYTHYKVVVAMTANVDNATRYFEVGSYTTNVTTIVFDTEQNKKEISVDKLFEKKLFVEEAEGLAVANNILYHYGVTNKKELNLQPVVNLIGELGFRWQTHITTEDLYQDGVLSSKYTGYSRDEVVPVGIRFKQRGGYQSTIFPLVGRNATDFDLDIIPMSNQDRASLEANSKDCNGTLRDKRWQIYNTAVVEDGCGSTEDISYIEVTEPTTKFCTVESVAEIPSGEVTISPDNFTNLTDFIDDIMSSGMSERDCESIFEDSSVDICSYIYDEYESANCESDPFEGLDCDSPEIESTIHIQEVVNERYNDIYKVFPEEYNRSSMPKYCTPFQTNSSDGSPIKDEEASAGFGMSRTVYQRDYAATNESCNYAEELNESAGDSQTFIGYFNSYDYSLEIGDLQTSKSATVSSSIFPTLINKKALWFKASTDRDHVIIDVSKQAKPSRNDIFVNIWADVRISIFKNCSQNTAMYSKIARASDGAMFLIEKSGSDMIINSGGTITTITDGWPSNNTVFIIVETPTIKEAIAYFAYASGGCYSVSKRYKEVERKVVSWDSIKLEKRLKLMSTCSYEQPIVNSCQAIPFSKGNFGYHESLETYPDNKQLWDSSKINILEGDLPKKYESLVTNNLGTYKNGELVWSLDDSGKPLTDLTCRGIRHFRLPDNKVAPFMETSGSKLPFSNSLIFPLGFTIDEELVVSLLNVAEKNGLITKKEREDIVGYEILRGDISLDRSVVASGLLYDMREYTDNGKKLLYANYPYNSYSQDKFNIQSQAGFGLRNNSYTFHSPETDYFRPGLPTEMSVQGYSFGNASIYFDEVKDHPKWVVISSKARNLASTLATLEVAVETVIATSSALASSNLVGGFTNTVFPGSVIGSVAIAAAMTAQGVSQRYSKYRYEWQNVFQNMGTPQNFAYYQFGKGHYNRMMTLQENGNKIRGLNVAKYLKDGRFVTTNEVTGERISINNELREYSVFLNTGKFNLNYSPEYYNYDRDSYTSSLTYSGENGISESGRSPEIVRNVASPYVHLKQYLPSQYGTVYNINWLTTGYHGDLTNPRTDCLTIFGGDTVITRHSLKRKQSQFLVSAMGQADRTPFNYYFYNNIGKTPKFYASIGIDKDFENGGKIFPSIENDFVFDNSSVSGFYHKTPSKFYLYHYGIPSFLCETRIDTTKRYGETDYHRQFDEIVDIADWTQEKNVSIRERNWFFYNKAYSKQVTKFKALMLQQNYDKSSNDCRADFPNGIISSMPDNSENNTYDPWLIYRGADFFEFRADYGKLVDIVGIENEAILARFNNTSIVFNKVDYTNDDGQNPSKVFLGGTSVFQRRSASYVNAELGYGGTQNVASVSNEFGHFHADAMRGQVIKIPPGGGAMEEISSIINGKSSGKRQWFKEHLPFKILKYFKNVDIDNNFNGVGLSFGWDSRFRRVLLTKRDYIPKSSAVKYDGSDFYIENNGIKVLIDLTNTNYFEDVSWTIAYSPVFGGWTSYYDFKPNYYINHNDYFQTGLNQTNDYSEFGLWSHGLTNKSYNVFYGKKYPFEVESIVKAEADVKRLESIKVWTEAKRYHNDYDFAVSPKITFNESIIYNNIECSGKLNLIPQMNNFVGNSKYPITNRDNTQDILISNIDNFKWGYNYFYNRVKTNVNNYPIITFDKNQIGRDVNSSIVSFNGKRLLERLDGHWFLNKLKFDKDSRYSLTLKFLINELDV